MNLIFVTMDSLNRHFLKAYGQELARTPNIDRLAARSAVFENHTCGSLPCMPARREMLCGFNEMWWRGWGPMECWDRPIAYLAGLAGIKSQLVTDHYHYFEWGSHSYHYDYEGYTFIRGHEHDNHVTKPVRRQTPDTAAMLGVRKVDGPIYARNVQDFADERDFFGPRTFAAACDWLDDNAGDERPFYLHIDAFDPHEPFQVPEPYRSMYTDDPGPHNYWTPYGRAEEHLSRAQLNWVRAQYAGKVTMLDTWFGKLLDKLDQHQLWENTAVIFTTDHGHYLGEHGWLGKPKSPTYDTIAKIPLIIYLPGKAARRIGAVTQTIDLYATALELLGCRVPDREARHSRSLVPLLRGETQVHRPFAVYGYFGESAAITLDGFTLCRSHDPSAAPIYQHTNELQVFHRSWSARLRADRRFGRPDMEPGRIPGVETPVWRAEDPRYNRRLWDDYLFDLASDPDQKVNVAERHPARVRELTKVLGEHLRDLSVPEEVLARLHV